MFLICRRLFLNRFYDLYTKSNAAKSLGASGRFKRTLLLGELDEACSKGLAILKEVHQLNRTKSDPVYSIYTK